MFTIPNQSSVAKAYTEFDAAGRMKPSSYYDRIVDVVEELVRFTVLLRPPVAQLVDRYSERVEADRQVLAPAAIPSSIDGALVPPQRSYDTCVGNESVSPCKSRRSPS